MAHSYTTVQGDTWDSIAFRLWGEERHMHLLLAANPEFADVLIFPADIILRLPPAPQKGAKLTLPPWMEA